MTLLERLTESISKRLGIPNARTVHFAFAENGDVAFLSELALEELVPYLEVWCREQRKEMKVH